MVPVRAYRLDHHRKNEPDACAGLDGRNDGNVMGGPVMKHDLEETAFFVVTSILGGTMFLLAAFAVFLMVQCLFNGVC